jgi:hypothetical protein
MLIGQRVPHAGRGVREAGTDASASGFPTAVLPESMLDLVLMSGPPYERFGIESTSGPALHPFVASNAISS